MRKFKSVIISAVVLVVAIVAALLVMNLAPVKNPAEVPVGEDAEDTSIKISDYDAAEISSIEFIDAEGGFVIDYFEEKVGIGAKVRDADPRLRYDEYEMTTLPHYLAALVATEKIGDEDASLFGFEKAEFFEADEEADEPPIVDFSAE